MSVFMAGGVWMYVVILVSALAMGLGLAATIAVIASAFWPSAAIPARLLAAAVLLGAICTFGSGLAGTWLGWQQVEEALLFVDPQYRRELETQGWYEATIPGYFGAGMGAGVGMFGLILLGASFAAPQLARSE